MLSPERISLYVHIPFCETKCPYCDFNTYARIESLIPSYIPALDAEITLWGELLEHPTVHTVFFGGGTPSYLPAEDISVIMDAIRDAFRLESDAEVTLEANPDDFNEAKLSAIKDAGINRLSIGVQTFDDDLLKMLGRRHSVSDAIEAYQMAKLVGLDNVSFDLMYGLPNQTARQWKQSLETTVELNPLHVSMYCLTLEGGTPMEQWVKLGKMPDPDPDLAADMYLMAQDVMREQGYRHYEISNWSREGFESRHNLTYWRNEPYLGVGPGAHSYLGSNRFYNLKSPREYISRLENDDGKQSGELLLRDLIEGVSVVETIEDIDQSLEMAETMMMGLRLDTGISVEGFSQRFGEKPQKFYGKIIDELTDLGLLKTEDNALRLTHRGRMLGNEVFSRFFA